MDEKLTPAEIGVLRLIAAGYGNKEIADRSPPPKNQSKAGSKAFFPN